MWETGIIHVGDVAVKYEAKVFEEGSQYGIDGGRISRLWMAIDGEEIINYDRGWDMRPETEIAERVHAKVLEFYS